MQFYVSWVAHDPEYQGYDPDCSLLVSPVAQPKTWSVSSFRVKPRNIMLDSGSFYLLRHPDLKRSPREVLTRQLDTLEGAWQGLDVTICHMDYPILGDDPREGYAAVEATIANAYELKAMVEAWPRCRRLGQRVKYLGVIQGADPEAIRYCARELVRVGLFQRYGLGSLAPLMDPTAIAARVRAALEVVDDLHVFGVSSLTTMRQLRAMGVRSFDSSRPIRAAIHCTLLYGSPLKCHTIAGTLQRPTHTIRRARPCDCPVCRVHRRELLKVGAKRYNNYRALHNYLVLKRELCGDVEW